MTRPGLNDGQIKLKRGNQASTPCPVRWQYKRRELVLSRGGTSMG